MLDTTNSPNRRRWLGSAALLTAGAALASRSLFKGSSSESIPELSAASFVSEPSDDLLITEIPSHPEPAPETPPPITADDTLTYEEFLSRFDLRHIKPSEIIRPHLQTTRGYTNSLPPVELWPAMPTSLFVADEIRERLGRPLKLITSAYRNPEYNKACGGATFSWHTKNCALDLVYEANPHEVAAVARKLRDEGFFKGGIGIYHSFVHIDTRGHNATWQA